MIPRRDGARTRISLNGVWQLEPGNALVPPAEFSHTVPVPALVDCATSTYDWPSWTHHWYRMGLQFDGLAPSDAVLLRLDRAQYGTNAWLNTENLGGSLACYTTQEYTIDPSAVRSEGNLLTVRVGSKDALPQESAVGRDQEKETFIPGIWGDVAIIVTGRVRIRHVQVIPRLDAGAAEARVCVENLDPDDRRVSLIARVFEKKGHIEASHPVRVASEIHGRSGRILTTKVPLAAIRPWSPGDPFLYEIEVSVESDGTVSDRTVTTFGMREFTINGSEFRLNGKRVLLRGSNIAFHRFLSDPERGLLPWKDEWIRAVLAELPRTHHFNFFRFHLGRAYERWYDIADECGILLQDEWPFWGVTGSREQIVQEFVQWIRDGCNHPSIVIWDPLNECSDPMIQEDIVPTVRRLDPTRPWESVDFVEQHPYIYSLAEVLNTRPVGFTKALPHIEQLTTPSVVNEFLWWWLDSEGSPTSLMEGVVERWLGPRATKEQLSAHQQFLAQELVELFRRMDVDAIQPFVYLSNNRGPTANWFQGPIKNLEPKPVVASLRNAFAPFGISIELWDRHFVSGDEVLARLFVFNDHPERRAGTVRLGFTDSAGRLVLQQVHDVTVEASDRTILPVRLRVPGNPGKRHIRGELLEAGSEHVVSWSQKPVWCLAPVKGHPADLQGRVVVLDPTGEIGQYLSEVGIPFALFEKGELQGTDVVLVHLHGHGSRHYARRLDEVSRFVDQGGALILQEPEYGVEAAQQIAVTIDLALSAEKRAEPDRGGYDSVVFPEDERHPLWRSIDPDQLVMFNGGVGGEMVSQHSIQTPTPVNILARSGLRLGTAAVGEVKRGRGTVVISRIQVRGRLLRSSPSGRPDERRMDPVAQQYLLNLLGAFR